MDAALTIRPMRRDELELGIDWAAAEGWNPGLHDAGSFFAADAGGFLLGLVGAEPVGMVSVVRYGAGFGFLGFYIVRPAWRGQGHGLRLWQAGMARLAGRVVGLDGVVAQQANYRKSGFQLAWNNVRWQGVAVGGGPLPSAIAAPTAADRVALLDYDAAMFPDDRRRFMAHWLAQPGSIVRLARQDGAVAGFGVIRPCRAGWKIGPLFADTPAIASDLITTFQQSSAGQEIFLDFPDNNPAASALRQTHHQQEAFGCVRMYHGPPPELDHSRIFGITTFEVG